MNEWSIVATILSIVGQFGVTYQKIWGLYVWMLSNVFWIYVDIKIHPDYAQMTMYMFYLVMNYYSTIVWKRNVQL
jgi:hypothetical protein